MRSALLLYALSPDVYRSLSAQKPIFFLRQIRDPDKHRFLLLVTVVFHTAFQVIAADIIQIFAEHDFHLVPYNIHQARMYDSVFMVGAVKRLRFFQFGIGPIVRKEQIRLVECRFQIYALNIDDRSAGFSDLNEGIAVPKAGDRAYSTKAVQPCLNAENTVVIIDRKPMGGFARFFRRPYRQIYVYNISSGKALRTYTKRVFSMYGGEQRLVEIHFVHSLLDAVVDRFGTKDVLYAKVDDTYFGVTAKVEISDQFFGWLLGFGNKAKLVYPDDIMEQFRGYLDSIREMY